MPDEREIIEISDDEVESPEQWIDQRVTALEINIAWIEDGYEQEIQTLTNQLQISDIEKKEVKALLIRETEKHAQCMNKTNQVDANLQISLKEYQKMQRKFEALQERNQTLTKAEELAKTRYAALEKEHASPLQTEIDLKSQLRKENHMYSSLNRRCDTFFEEMKQLEADNTRLGSQNEALQARFSELIEIRNDFTRLEPIRQGLRDLLKCGVCREIMTLPIGLCCGHIFCHQCLQDEILIQTVKSASEEHARLEPYSFPCPECSSSIGKATEFTQIYGLIAICEILRAEPDDLD